MINSSVNRIVYEGDGINTIFPYPFAIMNKSDIKVILVAGGRETPISSNYYIDQTLGDVVVYPGYPPGADIPEEEKPPLLQQGEQLVIYRDIPITQLSKLPSQYPWDVNESALDKLTMIAQQLADGVGRSMRLSEAAGFDTELIVPVAKGKSFRWADDGKSLQVTDDPAEVKAYADSAVATAQSYAEQTEGAFTAGTAYIDAAKNDVVTMKGQVSTMMTTVTEARDVTVATKEEALTSIATDRASALNAINSDKADALSAINSDKTTALNAINSAKTTALNAIANDKATALSAINTDKTDALSAIDSAKTTGVNAVNSAKTTGVSAVNTAKTEAVNTIDDLVAQATAARDAAVTAQEQAEGSASTASTKASEAATSANTASTKATAAAGSATTASTKASEASASATKAQAWAESSTAPATGSKSAKTWAEEAKASATTASTKASEASTSASNALSYRNTASTYATNASNSANSAAQSAELCANLVNSVGNPVRSVNNTSPDNSGNVTLPTITIAQGGTGATTASQALTNLGLTATATELNYMDGVTSNVQTQLNGKAPSSHSHSTSDITGLDTALAGKAPTSHSHSTSDITGLPNPVVNIEGNGGTATFTKADGTTSSFSTGRVLSVNGTEPDSSGNVSITVGSRLKRW